MKTLKLIFVFVVALGMFSSFQSFAQVKQFVDEEYNFTVKVTKRDQNGEIIFVKSYELTGVELIKVNEIGKILRILTFRLSENDIMELANPSVRFNIKSVTGDFDGDNEPETVDGQYAVLTKTGNLKLVYHDVGK